MFAFLSFYLFIKWAIGRLQVSLLAQPSICNMALNTQQFDAVNMAIDLK
jgi:hypothetical protein